MARVVPTIGQAVPGKFETAAWWNSQVQALGQFLLNPPRFSGYYTGTQVIATGTTTWTSVLIDTEVEDTDGGHSTVTNTSRYTCQVAGMYLFTGSATFAGNATGFRAAKLRLNGSSDVLGSEQVCLSPTAAFACTVPVTASYVRMAVGDYVEMQVVQSSGGNLNLTASGSTQPNLTALWIAA